MEREINRLNLWNTVLKITKDEKQALVETNYFDQVLRDYDDNKYCKIMSEICTSYYIEPELLKEDRNIFVKGMIFAVDNIEKLNLKEKYENYDSSKILSYVNRLYNSYLEKSNKSKKKKDIELFRQGLMMSTILVSSRSEKPKTLKRI